MAPPEQPAEPLVRLNLVLHNHQPVGNFDSVCQQAFEDSYLPFLDVFEPFEDLRIGLHVSGCLMEWLDARQPAWLDRIARLVQAGRIEIVGGAFYEPILTMLPARDRIGQIERFSRWLEDRLGAAVAGMWVPERVWEPSLTTDIVAAGIRYVLLDDFHFRCAGLTDAALDGYWITEDQGRTLAVFPGSERLRYLIPFREPEETIAWCREVGTRRPGSVVVFGDDGEKFGTWPETKQHVYANGWLRRFFEALVAERNWLSTCTPSESLAAIRPRGKVWLPDASYREMTEWALPTDRQEVLDRLVHELEHLPAWPELKQFVRGGTWRNFRRKYVEADGMYCRMMYVSSLLQQARQEGVPPAACEAAQTRLYRAQCNCGYWHGAFGGVYLPHLRNAVYQNLIAAENLIESHRRESGPWIEAAADDFNFDGLAEVRLANDRLVAWLAPGDGGQMYGLDLRQPGHNLLATMQRRREAYHDRILQREQKGAGEAASIHDRVVLKRNDLDQFLATDPRPARSFREYFWETDPPLDLLAAGRVPLEVGFADGEWMATIRRNPERIQVLMERDGEVPGARVRMTKGITLAAGSSLLEMAWMLEGLPQDFRRRFAVEFHFAGLPDGQDDRYFSTAGGRERQGQLGTMLHLPAAGDLGLHDDWLGVHVRLAAGRPAGWMAYPVRCVSQSESGFELVHQSVAVFACWDVIPDREGRWSVRMSLDTACRTEAGNSSPSASAGNAADEHGISGSVWVSP